MIFLVGAHTLEDNVAAYTVLDSKSKLRFVEHVFLGLKGLEAFSITLKLMRIVEGSRSLSESSRGIGTALRPSGIFLKGSDIPLKEPYNKYLRNQPYFCDREFESIGIIAFLKIFSFPRCHGTVSNRLLFGEAHIVKFPFCGHWCGI